MATYACLQIKLEFDNSMKELELCESEKKKIEAKHMKKVAHTHEEEVKNAQEFEHAMSRQQHGLVFIALLT